MLQLFIRTVLLTIYFYENMMRKRLNDVRVVGDKLLFVGYIEQICASKSERDKII